MPFLPVPVCLCFRRDSGRKNISIRYLSSTELTTLSKDFIIVSDDIISSDDTKSRTPNSDQFPSGVFSADVLALARHWRLAQAAESTRGIRSLWGGRGPGAQQKRVRRGLLPAALEEGR